MDPLNLLQVGHRVIDIAGCYRYIQDHAAVRIYRLMSEVMLPAWLPRTFHMSGFRVCPTDPLPGLTPIFFDLFDPLLSPFSCPAFQFLQTLFLIGVQPFPVYSGTLRQLHQFL